MVCAGVQDGQRLASTTRVQSFVVGECPKDQVSRLRGCLMAPRAAGEVVPWAVAGGHAWICVM